MIRGHAGYDEAGQDIVCAGISVLTIALLNGFEAVVGIQEIEREVDEGYTSFVVPKDEDPIRSVQIDALVRTFELGVRETALAYPEYIKVLDE